LKRITVHLSDTLAPLGEVLSFDVSDFVHMAVFTSAESAQYVEIWGQGRKQTYKIPGLTS